MTSTGPQPLASHTTPIPGVVLYDLPVYGDGRGWFKENWQREKMIPLGLPDFHPVQNNISFNEKAGTTRGIHAEPWDKFISVASGRIFGAWVDLREGPTFGAVFTAELDPSKAIFIPRGVGNAFQTTEDNTVYTYLVNDHWSHSAQAQYTFLNLADETVSIDWPIPLHHAELSDKDRAHPRLADLAPMRPRKILVLGANGQVGRALRREFADFPAIEFVSRKDFNLQDPESFESRNWRDFTAIINAAAYTSVDDAETPEGMQTAWSVNAEGVGKLAATALKHSLTLIHISSDYVFDGVSRTHDEEEPMAPLGVYGQSKAAGDVAVGVIPKHYIVRTSWVVGEGRNFIQTMASLAEKGVSPSVVNDQVGRLTFASDLAQAIRHLWASAAPYGTYNVTNDGDAQSWASIAKKVYELKGIDAGRVSGVSTADYYNGKKAAPRPLNSELDISKIKAAGFSPRSMDLALVEYLQQERV